MLYSEQPTNYSSAGVLILLNRKRTQTARVGVGCLNFVSRFGLLNNDKFFFSYSGHSAEFYLGYGRQELIGVSWYQLLHWDCVREAQSKHRLSKSFIHSFIHSFLPCFVFFRSCQTMVESDGDFIVSFVLVTVELFSTS